jgi:hypothetical protein
VAAPPLPDGLLLAVGAPGRSLARTGGEPREHDQRQPDDGRGDAVLTWWVVAPAACPGKNDGRDFAGSAK